MMLDSRVNLPCQSDRRAVEPRISFLNCSLVRRMRRSISGSQCLGSLASSRSSEHMYLRPNVTSFRVIRATMQTAADVQEDAPLR
jgi:hypothetical protein